MNIFLITLIRPLILIVGMIKFCLWGDFNTEISEQRIESFLYMHELCNLVKEKTYFKNMQNSSCTDLLLTNVYAFQQTTAICAGLSFRLP